MKTNSLISSDTSGDGAAGDVNVTGRRIVLDGAGATRFTGITAVTSAGGNAGSVRISSDSLQLVNEAVVSSESSAGGAGGRVVINVNELTLKKKSAIDSAAFAPAGTGGGVTIFAGDSIRLRDSRITTQAGGEGGVINIRCPGTIDLIHSTILTQAGNNGGDMTIDPSFVILENSRLSANGGNNGGNITVRPDWLLQSQSSITATGTRGVGGTLQITPDYNLTGALLSLPASLSDSLRLQPACAADLPGAVSSFIVTGRGAPPLQPGGWTPDLELRLPAQRKSKE